MKKIRLSSSIIVLVLVVVFFVSCSKNNSSHIPKNAFVVAVIDGKGLKDLTNNNFLKDNEEYEQTMESLKQESEKLVELIKGQKTSEEVCTKIKDLATAIGKTPVMVNEAPGFVVNRILIPLVNEGIGILADGIASKEEIDEAMKLGANHPMGPLALGDLIGLDVCLAIMEVFHAEFGDDKYRPHPLLRKMVRANLLGRKTGEGFYKYNYNLIWISV